MVLLLADRIEMPVQLGDIEIAQQLGMDGELVEPPAPVVDGNGDADVYKRQLYLRPR